jgi:hypothetical protein
MALLGLHAETPACSRGFLLEDAWLVIYRPAPAPGAGLKVDPLGDGLIALFPDGFRALFAPAAALPAPLLSVPVVEVPVVVPLTDDPVVAPVAGVPVVELAPAEPVPL